MSKLRIPVRGGFLVLEYSSIRYLESSTIGSNTVTRIYTDDEDEKRKEIISSRLIGEYEQELTSPEFLRVHKSYIINVNRVIEYSATDGNRVILDDKTEITVSKNKTEELEMALGFQKKITEPAPGVTVPYSQLKGSLSAKGWLVVLDAKKNFPVYPLRSAVQVIGRKNPDKTCDIMIDPPDMRMSRHHFEISIKTADDGTLTYTLQDLGSVNHTYVNEQLVDLTAPYSLQEGDLIQAGDTRMVFLGNKAAINEAEASALVKGRKYI